MKFSFYFFLKIILISFVFIVCASAHESHYGPTETIFWDNSKAFNGYTLYGVGGTTYLIDMEGQVVHTWKTGTNPRLTHAGTVYDAAGGDPSKSTTWKEYDWNGNDSQGNKACNGTYFYSIQSGNDKITDKLLIIQ